MPAIRNSSLIKRFTDFFKLKVGDMLDGRVTPLIVPTINMPVPKKIVQIIDVEINDSDKTITVPSGKQWKLLFGTFLFATTVVVGDRQIIVRFMDSSNILYEIRALNVQIASTTERYNLGQFSDVSEAVTSRHLLPIPVNVILPEDFQIRIFDVNGVDITADDLTIGLVVEEIDVTGEGI